VTILDDFAVREDGEIPPGAAGVPLEPAAAEEIWKRSHLTGDERAIRRSRGIPLWRLLPYLVPVVAIAIMVFDSKFFPECLGHSITPHGAGRGQSIALAFGILLCTPSYVSRISEHWPVIALFFVGIGLAVPQYFWMKRHRTYWDTVREKERLKRAQKKSAPALDVPEQRADG
jgi:hypothetical protein